MCGISGIVSGAPVTTEDRVAVAAMTTAMTHRGPDDDGWIEAPRAVMAMRRLSIIDVIGASQPLTNADGKLRLIINGEIYNYLELRAELERAGQVFRTRGDGEVVLGLYARYGLDFVHHLRGMFAIALMDDAIGRVILARDRMGEKPLYLHETPGRIIFASEMKGLLASRRVDFALDPTAVHLFFHYQYVPEPLTAVRGVRKLDAGHMLVVDLHPWRVREQRYWSMADAPPITGDPVALIRERLDEASRLTLRSDVPVGIALSGGLDSSVIAALAARHGGTPLAAFSVGYPDRPPNDERRDAAAFAATLGIRFHDIELRTEDMVEFFRALNYWRDDPIADIAGFGYFAAAQRARDQGVKVILQGQGGDELFWGYSELRAARAAAIRAQRRHGPSRTPWRGVARKRARMPSYDKAPDYRAAFRHIRRYYTPDFAESVRHIDPAAPFTFDLPWPDVDVTLTEQVCVTYLRENGIAQSERLAMASSVELRLPFMDHRLVETIIGLRKTGTDAALPAKTWLKSAVQNMVPSAILDRRKQGFAPPVRAWHDALFKRYGPMLRDGELVAAGVLSRRGAERLAQGRYPANAVAPLSFKALTLEMWCRRIGRGS